MPGKPECLETTMKTEDGSQVMIAVGGNTKFEAGTKHPRCKECLASLLAEAEKQIRHQDPVQMKLEVLKLKQWKLRHGGE